MLYKIEGKKLEKIDQTTLRQEGKLEQNLEDWIENDPSVLKENLLIIGRQVQIPEVKDTIDLLALDTKGYSVIIEIKRGRIKDPVDIQSLRYASYISRWGVEDVEEQAKRYFLEKGEAEPNFIDKFEDFCDSASIKEVPDVINQEQRIIIIGGRLKDKLGSVALWLRDHGVDIKIIEVSVFRDKENLFLSPQVIIPPPTPEKFEIGKPSMIKDRPWLINGEEWHLEKRCGKIMKQKLIQLINIISENFETLEGPYWNQQDYISFREENSIWLSIHTHKSLLSLNLHACMIGVDIDFLTVAINQNAFIMDYGCGA